MQVKLIFTRKVVHLAALKKWEFLDLGSGQFTGVKRVVMITEDKSNWYFNKFSPLLLLKTQKVNKWEFGFNIRVQRAKRANLPLCSSSSLAKLVCPLLFLELSSFNASLSRLRTRLSSLSKRFSHSSSFFLSSNRFSASLRRFISFCSRSVKYLQHNR